MSKFKFKIKKTETTKKPEVQTLKAFLDIDGEGLLDLWVEDDEGTKQLIASVSPHTKKVFTPCNIFGFVPSNIFNFRVTG